MQIITRKDGTKRYRVSVYLPNKTRKVKLFKRKTDAKIWLRKMQEQNEQYIIYGIKQPSNILFGDFSEDWLKNIVKAQKSQATFIRYKRISDLHLMPVFGELSLNQIHRSKVNELITKLKESHYKERGINFIVGVLKTILNEAVRQEYLIKSPLNGIQKLKIPPQEDVYWTEEEVDQFLKSSLNSPLYSFYVMALNTGMRKGEIGGLCWDRVNLRKNQLEITRTLDRFGLKETTKTTLKRIIPINHTLKEVLIDLKGKRLLSKYVFCHKNGQPIDVHHLDRQFRKDQIKAKITNKIHFHALRHTFASHFMMNDGNIYDLQKILGHSRIEMTQRYSHLSPEHLKRAIEIVSFSGNKKSNGTVLALDEKNRRTKSV